MKNTLTLTNSKVVKRKMTLFDLYYWRNIVLLQKSAFFWNLLSVIIFRNLILFLLMANTSRFTTDFSFLSVYFNRSTLFVFTSVPWVIVYLNFLKFWILLFFISFCRLISMIIYPIVTWDFLLAITANLQPAIKFADIISISVVEYGKNLQKVGVSSSVFLWKFGKHSLYFYFISPSSKVDLFVNFVTQNFPNAVVSYEKEHFIEKFLTFIFNLSTVAIILIIIFFLVVF